eukprot:489746-Hanusia_phi.AAC.1
MGSGRRSPAREVKAWLLTPGVVTFFAAAANGESRSDEFFQNFPVETEDAEKLKRENLVGSAGDQLKSSKEEEMMRKRLEDINIESERMKNQLDDAKKEKDSVNKKLDDAKKEKEPVNKKLDDAKKEKEPVNKKLEDVEKEKDNMTKQLDVVSQKATESHAQDLISQAAEEGQELHEKEKKTEGKASSNFFNKFAVFKKKSKQKEQEEEAAARERAEELKAMEENKAALDEQMKELEALRAENERLKQQLSDQQARPGPSIPGLEFFSSLLPASSSEPPGEGAPSQQSLFGFPPLQLELPEDPRIKELEKEVLELKEAL